MDPNLDAAIDVVEAAYNLELPAGDWLPNLLRAGEPLFDLGMGCYGIVGSGVSDEGVPIFTQAVGSRGAEEMPRQIVEAAREAGPDAVSRASGEALGKVHLLSDVRQRMPDVYDVITRHLRCKDVLSLTAIDPNGHGANISIPSAEPISLDARARHYWQMLEVHIAAGHRLRRGLGQEGDVEGAVLTDLPHNGDALIDPARFLVERAAGEAAETEASDRIRDAARLVDRARGPLRKEDPEEALRLWEGLVRGRWSLVDWFDSGGRRFVLAKPNAPKVRDPRGLTEREAQVATYAARGEQSKIIGYRLGLSQSYVSRLLRDAMRKLGVKTQAQLVEKMRTVRQPPAA